MPDVPDLAALALAHDPLYLRALRSVAEAIRRDAEAATSPRALVGRSSALMVADTIPEYLAVLALVDDLRAEIERLREANGVWNERATAAFDQRDRMRRERDEARGAIERVRADLAGSPAENKITSAPWRGLEGWNVGVEFRDDVVVVMARAPGQSVWRDLLTVTR